MEQLHIKQGHNVIKFKTSLKYLILEKSNFWLIWYNKWSSSTFFPNRDAALKHLLIAKCRTLHDTSSTIHCQQAYEGALDKWERQGLSFINNLTAKYFFLP